MARTTDEFIDSEVLPNLERLETKDWAFARVAHSPRRRPRTSRHQRARTSGGVDLDKISSLIVAERIARAASFATSYGGQANLCIVPIVLFRAMTRKRRDLLTQTRLRRGDRRLRPQRGGVGVGCARGQDQSDARFRRRLAAQAARRVWITNGGFADVIIIFAKVDGEHFTAFIVEKSFPGVSSGNEEHKMGLHGSSTTPIVLQDAARCPPTTSSGKSARVIKWRSTR